MKNSNRQIGDRPKVVKTLRLDADLVDWLEERARITGQSQTGILETAIADYAYNTWEKENELANFRKD